MKSHKYLISLLACIIEDAARKCSTEIGQLTLERDLMTIRSRIKHEGVSFVTITLPDLGKSFERCLEHRQVDSPCDFIGWKKRGCLPAFLQGFTSLVFDRTGKVKEDADVSAVEAIRQIAYAFKKLLLPCSQERNVAAIRAYLDCEAGLETFEVCAEGDRRMFNRLSSLVWGSCFPPGDTFLDNLVPKHGPGATVERIAGNRKWSIKTWHERLNPFFPMDSYILPSLSAWEDGLLDRVKVVSEDDEPPVRVTLVPKTLKAPRIIAIEPVCMQYTQQALARHIIDRLETFHLTSGHINFRDQSVNQKLALKSSSDGYYATLDLSEASDRVPAALVYDMLSSVPDLRDAAFACRSRRASLGGGIVPLNKFASMGSALCFPIEAMYFYTLVVLGLLKKAGLPVTLSNIFKVSRDVYVYGDDIIIPADAVEVVVETMQCFNCKVNAGKSFWIGKFRESCGMDAFDGEEVTPTYIRRYIDGKVSASDLLSLVATSNLFYKKGYWLTADWIKNLVERTVGKLPLVEETCAGLGWFNYQGGTSIERWNKKLHRFEVRTLVASPVYQEDHLNGWPALLKFFISSLHREPTDSVDEEHLSRSPQYGAVSMKSRWITPY